MAELWPTAQADACGELCAATAGCNAFNVAKAGGRCCLKVRGTPTWTIPQHHRPDHLRLWYNELPELQIALITSGCGAA